MTIADFYLGSTRNIIQYELLEISHPSFTKVYRIVRNNRSGLTVTLEDSSTGVFEYLPLKLTNSGARDDLDTGISVSFGDLGQVLPKELDRVDADDSYNVMPTVLYRTYRSDDLTAPLIGPYRLVVQSIAQNQSGATFNAAAPGLNIGKTGELYRVDRFPMLRGLL